ncbi:hypothetical protein [Chitinophaga nivalis]|uniref:Uncharacterized protein n=1 Tax=Chitinophaga nivalis TaxID=2991709 RepID=A0ABT3IKT2_9BACT|nr:hypothetical protein [Chitinophaga nivalis]MCW3465735.1 hypothetical protein [Chitinophaga nivalis]MCW3484574.1 hypothetical protein [Chitinophaga nivalis]
MSNHYLSALLLINALLFGACQKEPSKNTPDGALTEQTTSNEANSRLSHSDEVLTPGGWRPKAKVGLVDTDQYLDAQDGRLRKLDRHSKQVLADYGPIEQTKGTEPDYPRNVNVPARHVLPLGSGWITYTHWTNTSGKPISYFSTSWVVPPAPSVPAGQTIFLFNGLQNSNYILQPVLQWGPSAAGGGNYWAIANWYVDGASGPAQYSNLIRVNPGTNLQGIMALTGSSGSNYSYTSSFTGYPSITLAVNNIQQLNWAAESLEAYSVSSCSNYPATPKTRLTNIEIRTGSTQAPLSWTVANPITDCGQHSTVVTNGTPNGVVDVFY